MKFIKCDYFGMRDSQTYALPFLPPFLPLPYCFLFSLLPNSLNTLTNTLNTLPHVRSHHIINSPNPYTYTSDNRSAKDNRMPPSSSSLFVATSELIQVTLHSELAEDSNVSFLRSAFIVLAKRAKDCSVGKRKGLYGGGRFIPSIR